MRALKSGSSGVARLWKSPIPYLFGGLAIMMVLISVALVVLICSYSKRAYNSESADHEDTVTKPAIMLKIPETESEPKVVVIMAGDHNPTYLAKPTSSSSSTFCTCDIAAAGSTQ